MGWKGHMVRIVDKACQFLCKANTALGGEERLVQQ